MKPIVAKDSVSFLSSKGPISFQVETVRTPEDVARGLMHRPSLALDRGMLFVFPDESVRTFWMKNTLVSLDMIFLNRSKVVVGVIENARVLSPEPLSIPIPAQYVLEINAGLAKARAISKGTQAEFALDTQ